MNLLSLTPENRNLLKKTKFYSDLKKKEVSDDDYESSLYLFETLKMRSLSDMNDLYNAQDVILLCEIARNRFQYMHEFYDFIPRRRNSARTLSGCIEREMFQVIIALPTSSESTEIFEQTVTGGFSSVNTRLVFDTLILLPNSLENTDSEKVDNLDNSDDLRKDYKNKICYKLKLDKLDNEKEYTTKRVITKILKLDENNQYVYGVTKPLPTGLVKQDPDITWRTFNLLLERVSLEDSIGYLFIVDIEFDYYNASAKQRVYNEIYPSTIGKETVINPCERSVINFLSSILNLKKATQGYIG